MTFVLLRRKFSSPTASSKDGLSIRSTVRRPLMGTQYAGDRHATIRVVDRQGIARDILDYAELRGKRATKAYSNFIVQSIQQEHAEKHQLIETWGADWIILYGQKPIFFQVSGILVSTFDFPWEAEFWKNYETLFRGTQLAKKGCRLFLEVDDLYISGYILRGNSQKDQGTPNHVPFSFLLYGVQYGYIPKHERVSIPRLTSGDGTLRVIPSEVVQVGDLDAQSSIQKPIETSKGVSVALNKFNEASVAEGVSEELELAKAQAAGINTPVSQTQGKALSLPPPNQTSKPPAQPSAHVSPPTKTKTPSSTQKNPVIPPKGSEPPSPVPADDAVPFAEVPRGTLSYLLV